LRVVTAFSDWLHTLPAAHLQALRDFRRAARAAHPSDPNYLAAALDAPGLAELLQSATSPRKVLTPAEEAETILSMPRAFVLALDH